MKNCSLHDWWLMPLQRAMGNVWERAIDGGSVSDRRRREHFGYNIHPRSTQVINNYWCNDEVRVHRRLNTHARTHVCPYTGSCRTWSSYLSRGLSCCHTHSSRDDQLKRWPTFSPTTWTKIAQAYLGSKKEGPSTLYPSLPFPFPSFPLQSPCLFGLSVRLHGHCGHF